MDKKVALVTGASSGIGMATALELQAKGFTVYGAARRTDRMQKLSDNGIYTLTLDVTDNASMVSCIDSIMETEGKIDILVNNAGYGSFGAIEDVPMEEAHRQLEVNLFGLARMTQLIIPSMRKNSFGKIVNISSVGGKLCVPFGGWYHTTKFAIEGFSDCLRMELVPFGIDVIIIEPGLIKTDWGIIAADNLKRVSVNGAYAVAANRTAEKMMKYYAGSMLTKPEIIAKKIATAVTVRKPKTRYIIGFGAKPFVCLKYLLSDRMFDRGALKVLG